MLIFAWDNCTFIVENTCSYMLTPQFDMTSLLFIHQGFNPKVETWPLLVYHIPSIFLLYLLQLLYGTHTSQQISDPVTWYCCLSNPKFLCKSFDSGSVRGVLPFLSFRMQLDILQRINVKRYCVLLLIFTLNKL